MKIQEQIISSSHGTSMWDIFFTITESTNLTISEYLEINEILTDMVNDKIKNRNI